LARVYDGMRRCMHDPQSFQPEVLVTNGTFGPGMTSVGASPYGRFQSPAVQTKNIIVICRRGMRMDDMISLFWR
jgi:hypothetical protein